MIAKGTPKSKCFADVFNMYSELGEPQNQDDWDKLFKRVSKINNDYRYTEAGTLSLKLTLALWEVIELDYRKRKGAFDGTSDIG